MLCLVWPDCGHCEPDSPVGHSEDSGQQGQEEVQAGGQPSLQVVKSGGEVCGNVLGKLYMLFFGNVLHPKFKILCGARVMTRPGLFWQQTDLMFKFIFIYLIRLLFWLSVQT